MFREATRLFMSKFHLQALTGRTHTKTCSHPPCPSLLTFSPRFKYPLFFFPSVSLSVWVPVYLHCFYLRITNCMSTVQLVCIADITWQISDGYHLVGSTDIAWSVPQIQPGALAEHRMCSGLALLPVVTCPTSAYLLSRQTTFVVVPYSTLFARFLKLLIIYCKL